MYLPSRVVDGRRRRKGRKSCALSADWDPHRLTPRLDGQGARITATAERSSGGKLSRRLNGAQVLARSLEDTRQIRGRAGAPSLRRSRRTRTGPRSLRSCSWSCHSPSDRALVLACHRVRTQQQCGAAYHSELVGHPFEVLAGPGVLGKRHHRATVAVWSLATCLALVRTQRGQSTAGAAGRPHEAGVRRRSCSCRRRLRRHR
jgi:hypothetical protein